MVSAEKWYTPNSINLYDITPQRRKAGGGVTSGMLVDTYDEALEQAKRYTKQRIQEAQRHLQRLEKL